MDYGKKIDVLTEQYQAATLIGESTDYGVLYSFVLVVVCLLGYGLTHTLQIWFHCGMGALGSLIVFVCARFYITVLKHRLRKDMQRYNRLRAIDEDLKAQRTSCDTRRHTRRGR